MPPGRGAAARSLRLYWLRVCFFHQCSAFVVEVSRALVSRV